MKGIYLVTTALIQLGFKQGWTHPLALFSFFSLLIYHQAIYIFVFIVSISYHFYISRLCSKFSDICEWIRLYFDYLIPFGHCNYQIYEDKTSKKQEFRRDFRRLSFFATVPLDFETPYITFVASRALGQRGANTFTTYQMRSGKSVIFLFRNIDQDKSGRLRFNYEHEIAHSSYLHRWGAYKICSSAVSMSLSILIIYSFLSASSTNELASCFITSFIGASFVYELDRSPARFKPEMIADLSGIWRTIQKFGVASVNREIIHKIVSIYGEKGSILIALAQKYDKKNEESINYIEYNKLIKIVRGLYKDGYGFLAEIIAFSGILFISYAFGGSINAKFLLILCLVNTIVFVIISFIEFFIYNPILRFVAIKLADKGVDCLSGDDGWKHLEGWD